MARVLVVDDVRDVADSFAELLTLFGHVVHVAYDGEQALEEIERSAPDAALVDIDMPGMNGLDLARLIREGHGCGIRLVAHSAVPRSAIVDEAAEAGFDAFLPKLAPPLELALVVRRRCDAPAFRTVHPDRRSAHRSQPERRSA
jgi:CheY-like chemotaxis protein